MKLTNLTIDQKNIYVGLLTEIQKNELINKWYAPDCYFNPLQDVSLNWVISVEEMEQCINPYLTWIKDLPLIPYEPKPTPFPPFE